MYARLPGVEPPVRPAMTFSAGMVTTDTLPDYLDGLFLDFDQAFGAAPFTVTRGIAGQNFCFKSCDSAFSAMIETGLAGNDCDRGRFDCRILVSHGGTGGMPFPPVWAEPFYRERVLEAALAPTKYRVHYFLDKSFWQVFDVSTKRGIQLMQSPDMYPDWEPGSPLRNFLHWHFGALGLRLVHAGTLAEGGTGVLLAGSGGSGKSSTVVAGVIHGLQSVGDDYVVVRNRPSIVAYPLFSTLKQDPAGYDRLRLATVLDAPAAINWQGKHQFHMSDISKSVQPDKISIRALCIPKITHGSKTRVVPASHKEAFLALAPSGVSQIPADRDKGFAFYAGLARDLPCMTLELGTDPVEISGEVRKLIAGLAR